MFIWSKNFKNQNWQQDLSHRQCFSIIWPFFLQEMVKYSIQWKMLVRCDQLTKQNRKIVRMTDILFCFSEIFHWNDYLPINKIRLSLNENKWKFRYCSTMTGSDIMKRPFVNLYEDTQLPCQKLKGDSKKRRIFPILDNYKMKTCVDLLVLKLNKN